MAFYSDASWPATLQPNYSFSRLKHVGGWPGSQMLNLPKPLGAPGSCVRTWDSNEPAKRS
jgi:hypothetical protein